MRNCEWELLEASIQGRELFRFDNVFSDEIYFGIVFREVSPQCNSTLEGKKYSLNEFESRLLKVRDSPEKGQIIDGFKVRKLKLAKLLYGLPNLLWNKFLFAQEKQNMVKTFNQLYAFGCEIYCQLKLIGQED